ncbi:MAG: sulfite exporter TauE/SafE family protein [Bacteriovoracaceae bacterium]
MSFEYWYVFPFAIFVCVFATSSGFSGAVLFQPFFYFVLKTPVANSIATGIATETIGMTGGAIQYARMGYHDFRIWKILFPFAIAGVLVGFFFFVKLPPAPLKALVGLSMVIVSLIQFFSLTKKFKTNFTENSIFKWRPLAIFAGAFSATTGTGVAEMTQPMIEHVGKVPTKKANATAILLEATADWLITILNIKLGNIRYDILVFSVSGVLIGSQIGPRIAPYISDKIAKTVFASSVGLIGLFYIWGYFK